MTTKQTSNLKLASSLTRVDFESFPIWKWQLDDGIGENNESLVLPVNSQVIPRANFEQYLVSAVAILKDGTEFPAYCEITVSGSRVRCVPSFVFLLDRQLDFVSNETDRLLSRYTKCIGNRPIKWRLVPKVEGEMRVRRGRVRRSLFYMVLSFLIERAVRKKFKARP